MKISIITATYNSEITIQTCIDSVLNQDYKDIEYIIVDGHSKDNTLNIIKSTAQNNSQIKWISEPDKGIYDALNKGLSKATGAAVGFVHSDDFLAETTTISKIVETFKTSDSDGVYGDLHYVQFKNPDKIVRNWISQPFYPKLLNRGWMPAHPTLFLKREVYLKHGAFNLNYKIAADYDFILRVFKQSGYTFKYLPQTIMKMRIGGASNGSLSSLLQKTKEDLKAARANHISFPVWVVLQKNLSKIPQLLLK